MDLRIFTEPQQGASYETQLRLAQHAEVCGFDAYFRSDHYLRMGDGDPSPGPTDSWITLAGIARETSSIRLGTLVSSATFRHPGITAISVAQVDEMSGGRVEFGLGTGWFAEEHAAYGIPFPAKRFGILEEQLEIITGLWNTPVGETYSFSGEHYTLESSPALPKPRQNPIPVIVGGGGPKRTPSIAARFASEYNQSFPAKGDIAAQIARVRAACEEIGRDSNSLTYSVALAVGVGGTSDDVARRATDAGRSADDMARDGIGGTAAQAVDELSELKELGISRIYLQVWDLEDHAHLDYIASEIMPQV